jgi:CRISPR-associated protein Cas1
MQDECTQRKRAPVVPRADRQCEECGRTFHPPLATSRFCSRPCYVSWWKVHVKARALGNANEVKHQLEAEGKFHRSDRGITDKPNPRTAAQREKRNRKILEQPSQEEDDASQAWAERARYWEALGTTEENEPDPFNARKVEQPPLVLNGHGVRLRIDNGALVVKNGFTHYPQDNPELRYFPGERKLPSRIIAIDNDGSLTFDVIAWLSRHRVPLVVLNWQGEVVSVSGDGAVYDPQIREAQLEARTNGIGLTLSTKLIREKVAGQQEALWSFWRTPSRDNGLRKLQAILDELETEPETIEALRMIEARAALAYFLCWHEVPIQWKGTGRKPIPDEWRRCGLRKGINLDGTNRHATHPVNAMLNYGYRVLESQVRIEAVAQGLDPTIGYMHASQGRRPALVFDLMEPLRPKVDRMVLAFVREHTFSPVDFVVGPTGVCRIHPQLARRVTELLTTRGSVDTTVRQAERELTADNVVRRTARAAVSRSGQKRGRPSPHTTQPGDRTRTH